MQQHPRFDVLFNRFLQADNLIFTFILFQPESPVGKFL